ncbi:hypothetical protein [Cellulosimicrobium marinum]|uniref:hypothetical protein n=1 Tax=Cellulosimicrobium marinum TaxID=1638992 RepID=UPI001E40B222|nr:hypothetical protein [Cellulosimicrobium marinum]MCB7135366.1 hypothetical protein [Cellulosimicrobium marinum]
MGAFIVFGLLMWPGILAWINTRDTKRDVREVKQKAEIAAHEVRPNSGHSLADAVNRIEAALGEHMDYAEKRDDELDRRLEALESRSRRPFRRR